MPHYVASHLGLRSLTMSHLWDARLKWFKLQIFVDFKQITCDKIGTEIIILKNFQRLHTISVLKSRVYKVLKKNQRFPR